MSELFSDINYSEYAERHDLFELLKVDRKQYGDVGKKIIHSPNRSVDNTLNEAYSVEMDDLIRLHYLVRKYNVVTVLEIGPGKSTAVFADALRKNQKEHQSFVSKNLRKNNAFELHSVETSERWANEVTSKLQKNLRPFVNMHITGCRMDTFNGRACTLFDKFPNVCADFIYLDGPDQYSPVGDVDGVSTRHPDRLPMVADLIRFEHFLLPGTIIVVDGRTANARFIKENFQLEWGYKYYDDFDQHVFVNISKPLGVYNKREVDFKNIKNILL